MSRIKIRGYRHPIWRSVWGPVWPVVAGGFVLVVLVAAYVLLPARAVNAAGSSVEAVNVLPQPSARAEDPRAQATAIEQMFNPVPPASAPSRERDGNVVAVEPATAEPATTALITTGSGPVLREDRLSLEQDIATLRKDLTRLSDSVQALRKEVHGRATRVGPTTANPSRSEGLHIIARGETLSGIAHRYGLRVGCLIAWNQLLDAHTIHPGERLHLSGTAPCASPAVWTRYAATTTKPGSVYRPARPVTGWVILGMNSRQVTLASEDEAFYLFKLGDVIPGAGRITALDSQRQLVVTTQGIINSVAGVN